MSASKDSLSTTPAPRRNVELDDDIVGELPGVVASATTPDPPCSLNFNELAEPSGKALSRKASVVSVSDDDAGGGKPMEEKPSAEELGSNVKDAIDRSMIPSPR